MSTDPYRSRVGGEDRIVERRDPVVWGGVDASGPLSPEQLAAFDADGFLILENWLDPATIEQCLRDVDALAESPEISTLR